MGDDGRRRVRVAVVGAGFGGLGTAIRLKRAGHHDFVVFDRGDEVGGTWRDNTYPGCACDVPSQMYSLSFAPNPDWTRAFSSQPEIWSYLRDCVRRHDLTPHLRLRHEVTAARWEPASGTWLVDTSGGRWRAQVLVLAAGPLSEPATPALPGLTDFQGEVFHSARWRHDLDLTGRRVAVVGTGASAIQFVPEIAPVVARLHVFQRTAPWVLPRADRPISAARRRLYRCFPPARLAARAAVYWGRELAATAFLRPALMPAAQAMARRHLRASISDPALRAALTPDYTLGCKRVLLSNDYYPALTRENVELVSGGVTEVRPDAVVTRDGRVRGVDTIIFGTGFRVTDLPVAHLVHGADGQSLAQTWQGGMRAYRGSCVPGFPNLFLLLGPNTGLGHNSVVFMIECQITYLLGLLRHLDHTGRRAVEPTARAYHRYTRTVDRRMAGTVWSRGGCQSWYLDAMGRNSTLWPGYTWSYWLRTRRFDGRAYQPVRAPGGVRSGPERDDKRANRRNRPGRGPGSAVRREPGGPGKPGEPRTADGEQGRPVNQGRPVIGRDPTTRGGQVRAPLAGQVIMITGAARGIGAETARLAAARGARLALVGLEPPLLAALAAELGPGHVWFAADVTDQAELARAVAGTVAALGGIDTVVANAGIANRGTIAVGDVEALARTVEVNLTGVMRTVAATVSEVAARRGYFLLVSSAAAFTALPGMAAYCASKAGVEQFGNVIRLELAHRGVQVGTAHPGWVDTDLVRDAQEDLPAFRAALARLPWPVGSTTSVRSCATAFVRAIERRRRRVYVPGPVGLLQAGRALVLSPLTDLVIGRSARTSVPAMEEQVRSLGRAFGRHTAAPDTGQRGH